MIRRIAFHTCFLSAFLLIPFTHGICADVDCYFSPRGQCLEKICSLIDCATQNIEVAAYQITNKSFCNALAKAAFRKISVIVIIDRGQIKASADQLSGLKASGVIIRVDRAEKLFHNKYLLIDDKITLTGSL